MALAAGYSADAGFWGVLGVVARLAYCWSVATGLANRKYRDRLGVSFSACFGHSGLRWSGPVLRTLLQAMGR